MTGSYHLMYVEHMSAAVAVAVVATGAITAAAEELAAPRAKKGVPETGPSRVEPRLRSPIPPPLVPPGRIAATRRALPDQGWALLLRRRDREDRTEIVMPISTIYERAVCPHIPASSHIPRPCLGGQGYLLARVDEVALVALGFQPYLAISGPATGDRS